MRNLRTIRHGICKDLASSITGLGWDAAEGAILCTLGPTEEDPFAIELVEVREADSRITHRTIASWDLSINSPDDPLDKVLDLHYFVDSGTTCLAFANGDVVIVREQTSGLEPSEPHIEVVGSIDNGIAAARWSPDEELLLIVTNDNNALFMSREFDTMFEVAMTEADLGASKHVAVGWGKKETQFQGRGARALRDPTIPEKVDEGVLSSLDDGSTTISWRGDGAYVAVNSIASGKRRIIRVYSREGNLDSASEPVDGLEGALSWRPSGNLIAGIQRLSDRVDVVFFERNGLRHGQFTLRSVDDAIRLEWNSDSTVLAIIFADRVQFWTTGNYHWYLKQEVPAKNGLLCFAWHPERALLSAMPTQDGLLFSEHVFTTSTGPTDSPYDFGAVAVVDGATLKVTPFRTANVPPPMSMFELQVEKNVVDVSFSHHNTAFAVLHQTGIEVYRWNSQNGRASISTLIAKVPLPQASSPQAAILPLQVFWTKEDELCLIGLGSSYEIVPCVVDFETKGISWQPPIDSSSLWNQAMTAVSLGAESDSALFGALQVDRGQHYRITDRKLEFLPVRFPIQLPWSSLREIGDGSLVAFGLSRNGHLYANSRILVKNCTSFVVTSSHLIFTTGTHLVKFVHLEPVEDMDVPADDPETDERCRSIERGAKLVTAMPTNMSIVLQMPRGNLETIFPRAMVLNGIRSLVEDKNYGRAFSYCRTQRVDMNILFDHRPAQLLENVSLFLDQLREVTYIDLFISSLRNEDVTQTMYKDTRRRKDLESNFVVPGKETLEETPVGPLDKKVNTICDALLKDLANRKSTNLQNLITAHVCKVPPALGDGLMLVSNLMKEDDKMAETAVEHICYLVDVNQLYNTALGLYDLELALLVAQQSQKDPREYLPYIQSLHKMSELRRQFTIDDNLDRRGKAIRHLHALNAHDEVADYAVKHSIYKDALNIYRYDQPRHQAILELYANYLDSKSLFREAGLAYESLGNFAKATASYTAAGAKCWQECLVTAHQQTPPLSPDSLAELASTLSEALWEAKEYSAAATIHDQYLDSVESAVRCLCKGYHFADAIRLVILRKRPELLATAVDSGIVDSLNSTTEFLADCKSQLRAQVPRIVELRRRAREDPLAFYEGERPGGVDIPDDISVAASSRVSTSASLFTRYTGKDGSTGTIATGVSRATSKIRRREEKKRARGRKGTVYEEEYLVNSVRRLVDRVESSADETARLVFALVRRGMQERARAVETLAAEVVEACTVAVREVFPPTEANVAPNTTENVEPSAEVYRPTGGDAVLQESIIAMSKKQEPPVLSAFAKLSLLG